MRGKAKFKYNHGAGALVCSKCHVIIKIGVDFNQDEWCAFRGEKHLDPQYCEDCKNKFYSIKFSGNI